MKNFTKIVSHMKYLITRWFEKRLCQRRCPLPTLQSLCTEAEAAANKQFYNSHSCEEMAAVYPSGKFGEQRSNETRHGSHRTGLCLLSV